MKLLICLMIVMIDRTFDNNFARRCWDQIIKNLLLHLAFIKRHFFNELCPIDHKHTLRKKEHIL